MKYLLSLLGCCMMMPALLCQSRPNIIYIMADDLGYGDLGCYGGKDNPSPQLDQLAAKGIRLTQAYAAAPVCTPTRTAFMTGQYPARTTVGLYEPLDWTNRDSAVGLAPPSPSVASMLQQAGYETWLVGKWHLGFSDVNSPMKNGFDYFYGYKGGGIDYVTHRSPDHAIDLFENDKKVDTEGYMTNLLGNKAVSLIAQKHDKPFFMSLQFSAPHWPWQAPGDAAYGSKWKEGGSANTYLHMVRSMDSAVGRILLALEQYGLAYNTLIIFTSDNGGERFSDNGGLRGRKMTLYEGGIRVPAIVQWPARFNKSGTYTGPVITMDWTATILAVSGAQTPASYQPDGINILPLLEGNKDMAERTFYWRLYQRANHQAMRQGPWKYLKTEQGAFLYHLPDDPGEEKDVKELHPQVFGQLQQRYEAWRSKMLTPIALPGK